MTIKTFEALASGETLELRIYGPIGAGLFGEGVTARDISNEIRWSTTHKRIVVKLNSPGGNAFEGMAIRAILAGCECETVAEVQGLAASAASIAAMGCKTIRMNVGTALMLHEARGSAMEPMDSKKLNQMANALEALNDGMASIYADRTGKTKAECRKLMAAETWLTAEQAVKDGFATEIVGDAEDAAAMDVAASFDLKLFGYEHAPSKFVAERPADADEEDDDETEPPPARDEVPPPANPNNVPPPPAATTADASVARKRLDTMTIKLIAQAAGLQADADDSAVVAAVSQLQAFVGELKTITKAPSLEAAIGAIRGLQAAAEQVPQLNAKISEQAKAIEAQERATLVAADKADSKGRKLTPAMEQFWATQPLDAFKAFLAVAPHQVHVQTADNKGQQQQAAKPEAVSGSAEASGVEILTHNGLSWEAMAPGAKADLKFSDPERYEALKRNHAERGAPRAQSQQQRASA